MRNFHHEVINSTLPATSLDVPFGQNKIVVFSGTRTRAEVAQLLPWCRDNNLSLNSEKTEEMIIDPRKRREQSAPLYINGTQVERMKTFKHISTYISEDLSWTRNTQQISRKAQKRRGNEEMWIILQTSQQLLQVHSGEYPEKFHHSVVWEVHH